MSKTKTKTLDDIMYDMSELYDDLSAGRVELKMAAEKANVTGKFLKAYQLQLAREIFTSQLVQKPDAVTALRAINEN